MTKSYRDSLKVPEDFDDPNDHVGFDLHGTTEENGMSCYPSFKGVREKQVQLPSREPNRFLGLRERFSRFARVPLHA